MKFLCQLQTLLDFLSAVAGPCRPYCESGLQAAAVFAELNKEVSVSSFSFQAPTGGLPSSLLLQVEAMNKACQALVLNNKVP